MVPDPAGYAGPIDAADQTVEEALAPRHDVPSRGRSGFTVIEGRQVHYLEWGHRKLPPVLCLHGGGQTAYMFEELGAAVADRFHLVAPDLPYHGDSDPLVGEFDFGPQAIAESMLPLLDQFGMDRVALVGASLGGLTSIRLAAAHPERVVSIALIDVGHRLEPEGVRRIIDFMRAHESFATLEEAAEEISRYLPQRKQVRPESLTRNLRQRSDGRWEWKHGFGRRFRDISEEDHPANNLGEFLAGVEQAAAGLECPVLVLRGDASDVLSQEGAEEVAAVIPNARLATVEKAGHLAACDNPLSTVNLISAFLAEQLG